MKQLLSSREGKQIVGTSAYLANVSELEHQKGTVRQSSDWTDLEQQTAAFRWATQQRCTSSDCAPAVAYKLFMHKSEAELEP